MLSPLRISLTLQKKDSHAMRRWGSLRFLGNLSSPVERVAFGIGPHNFHAACVDQDLCSSLHTSLNHILRAWAKAEGLSAKAWLSPSSPPLPSLTAFPGLR